MPQMWNLFRTMQEGRGRSRWRDQRLRDGERRRMMAIFAITEYARFLAGIQDATILFTRLFLLAIRLRFMLTSPVYP